MDYTNVDIEKIEFNHEEKIQIRFNDLDIFGHVNNAIQMYYFDFGKARYFEAMKSPMTTWDENVLVMVNINSDFLHPIYMGDNITVKTKIYEIGNKSVKFIQVLYDEDEKKVRSVCRSVMCGFNKETKTSVRISDEWRARISSYEKY